MDLRSLWTAPFPSDVAWAALDVESKQLKEAFPKESAVDLVESVPDTPVLDSPSSYGYVLPNSQSSSAASVADSSQVRRKPVPRKGHTKSRRGCFTCKKRKVKCSETRPQCDHCQKGGLSCEYPKPKANQVALQSPVLISQGTPTSFSMSDLRIFHHFIVTGYPKLPVGSDHTWTMEMPAIAHKYEYLLHAMMALGASHLGMMTGESLSSQALTHRVKALGMLNQAIRRPATSKEEADARFAVFMVLTTESSTLPDGLTDFLTMVRGCVMNGSALYPGSYFEAFTQDRHTETVDTRLDSLDVMLEPLDAGLLSEAASSLMALLPLVQSESQKIYHRLLLQLMFKASTSIKEAHVAFLELYNGVWCFSSEEFRTLCDTTDYGSHITRILVSHFLAAHVLLQQLLSHGIKTIRSNKEFQNLLLVMLSWVQMIHTSLPKEYKKFNEWPLLYMQHSRPHGFERSMAIR